MTREFLESGQAVPNFCCPTSLILWNPKRHPNWQEKKRKRGSTYNTSKFLPILWFQLTAGFLIPARARQRQLPEKGEGR